jgi:hypothetical protein
MRTFQIPNSQGQIRQSNSSELAGEIIESFNLDLTSAGGKIKVADKLTPVLLEGVDIGTPAGFCDMVIWDGRYWIITEDGSYFHTIGSNPDTSDPRDPDNWSLESEIDDNDLPTTAIPFDGDLLLSRNTNIANYDGTTCDVDWWTAVAGGPALVTGKPHTLEVVQTGKETLFVTDFTKVHYLEKGGTVKTVQLDSAMTAVCLAGGLSGAMWVGTFNENGGKAHVYEIYVGEVVGSTPVYRQAYPINAFAVLAIWTYNNTPYIVTEMGEIQQFNGAGFVTVVEFPFKFSKRQVGGVQPGLIQDSNRSRPIHPKGVQVHKDSVYINLMTEDDDSDYSVDTRSHSGVWEYNFKTGVLNHRHAFAHQSNDYGESKQEFAYPILVVDNKFTFLIAGGYDDANSKDNVYMTEPGSVNQGWFVTPEITSQSVTDAYEAVYHKAKILASGEEIVMQYRTSKRDTVYGTANWTSTTTFTSLSDLSDIAVGDLIRVSHGYAAGDYCNVTAIEKSALTYTVTVDRGIGAVGEISYVYSDNFKKEPTTYTSVDGEYKKMGGYGTNPWIQFMVILKGDIEYRSFTSKGNAKNEL